MATLKNSVLGNFSGKVGGMVIYQNRGKTIIRTKPDIKKNRKPTFNQSVSRARFKILNNWRNHLTGFFAITFRNHIHERSAQNAAHHYNAETVIGEYPNYKIDYTKVVISFGDLPGLKEIEMTVDENQMLHITWNKKVENGAKHGDLVALLIGYDESEFFQDTTAAAYRMNGELRFQLHYPPELKFADIYVTVIADDRQRAANSNYLGRINL